MAAQNLTDEMEQARRTWRTQERRRRREKAAALKILEAQLRSETQAKQKAELQVETPVKVLNFERCHPKNEVGEDDSGNMFYETKDSAKRWVIFNGESEATRVNPDWHGWLHHTWNDPPNKIPLTHKIWEKPHKENRTGTAMAHAPAGSLRQSRPQSHSDYEAWIPE